MTSAGLCVVEIERVAAAEKRFGGRFLRRAYTRAELAYCGAGAARAQRLAARFAAKAALRAAMRQAGLRPLPYRLIEVERDKWGMPRLAPSAPLPRGSAALLSLSHTRTLAAGYAVIAPAGGGARG